MSEMTTYISLHDYRDKYTIAKFHVGGVQQLKIIIGPLGMPVEDAAIYARPRCLFHGYPTEGLEIVRECAMIR